MFVVLRVQHFELEPAPGQPLFLPFPVVVDPQKMVGYLPVYETREDALADFPNAELVEIIEAKGE